MPTDNMVHTKLVFTTLLGIRFERDIHIGSVMAGEIDANNKVPAVICMVCSDPAKKGYYRVVDIDAATSADKTNVVEYTQVFGYALSGA